MSYVQNLSSGQVSNLRAESLTSDDFVALSASQLSALQTSQISALHPSVVGSLKYYQLNALSFAAVRALGTAQISALYQGADSGTLFDAGAVSIMPSSAARFLGDVISPSYAVAFLGMLSTVQVGALSEGAIHSLLSLGSRGNILDRFSSDQIQALTTSQVSVLSTSQLRALSPRANGESYALAIGWIVKRSGESANQ
jgi:hypothetical protein